MSMLSPINSLGTQFLIEIWDESDSQKLEAIYNRIEFLLCQFENNYSRFKPDSQISLLNHKKIIRNPAPQLIDILNMGVAFYNQTKGIHNLMIGEKLIATGYDVEYSFTAKDSLPHVPNPHDVLNIEPEKISLSDGMIDIGGYGKGIAIDILATTLKNEFGLEYFLINGDGDMFGTSNKGEPITIYLEHPTEPNTYLGTTTILNQGFGASSRHKRTWVHKQTRYSHIIELGRQTELANSHQFDASFITAKTATIADVFATVAILAREDEMLEFATQEKLGVATFTLPATFNYNHEFRFSSL